MINEKGSISIHTENIFPIIKKWLYSDKDIFIRELVSNSCDAISKFKKLAAIGEAHVSQDEKYEIHVVINKSKGTLSFDDNGIGMTADEVKKYINQIAFSGAKDFVEKYKDKIGEGNEIIGHFGLGFYSSFMVADKVEIETLSYIRDSEAVKWTSNGGTEFEITPSDRKKRGTVVTLFLNSEEKEFLDEFKVRQILMKYCSFMPYEIYLDVIDDKSDSKKEEQEKKPINDTNPLWLRNPKDCTPEEYKQFYSKVFMDFNEPLFWIHLNMDYPFNLKGILYFPKLSHEFQTLEGQIKLYYNQVFVADNIKEVIPEFLMLLKGAIDCPDLPLNVSRSFLQNDGYVKKISTHITKKVSDKLVSLFENERENYNKYWDDINPFVKYGCMKEEKFYEKVKDIVIFKTTNGDYATLKEYLERNREKHKDKVFYVTDEKQQAQYIKMFKDHNMEAVILSTMIDTHFIQFLEMKESSIKFSRVDADLSDSLKQDSGNVKEEEKKEIAQKLEKAFKQSIGDDALKIQVEALKSDAVPAIVILPEYSRRFEEMSKFYGNAFGAANLPKEHTLIVNINNSIINSIVKMADDKNRTEDVKVICQHVFDLAMMSHKQLEPDAMTRFIERSNMILSKFAGI